MKHLHVISLVACAVLFVGCETTETASNRGRHIGNQEAIRIAALEQEKQDAQMDEAQRNLWNTQHDILTRDGNAASHYY